MGTAVSSLLFTPTQLDTAVELFRDLLDHPRVEATSVDRSRIRTPVGCGQRDYPMPTDEQIRALVLSDGARAERADGGGYDDTVHPVEIVLASYSDYHGTDHDAANVRALATLPGVTVVRSGHSDGGVRAQVQLGAMSPFVTGHGSSPDADPDAAAVDAIGRLEQLVNTMAVTLDEVVIDDAAHVEYLIELAEAAWDEWVRPDLPRELRQLAGALRIRPPTSIGESSSVSSAEVPVDLDQYVTDLVDTYSEQLRHAYYSYDGNEWVTENATSVINARHTTAVQYAAATVFGWPTLPKRHFSWAA